MASSPDQAADVELGGLASSVGELAVADEDETSCAICLTDTSSLSTPLHLTQCAHRFCEQCLIAYLLKKPVGAAIPCPLCRCPLADDDIPRIFTIPVAKPNNRAVRLGLSLVMEATNNGSASDGGDGYQGGVRIRFVIPGSAAEAAGLRRGMALLAINGVQVTTVAQAIERLNLLRQQGTAAAASEDASDADRNHRFLELRVERRPLGEATGAASDTPADAQSDDGFATPWSNAADMYGIDPVDKACFIACCARGT